MSRDDYEQFEEEDLEEDLDEDNDAEDKEDWQDEGETDREVADLFSEAQNLDYGRGDLIRKLRSHTDKNPTLSGGDIDADWDHADVGEETVGGQNPTPDQSDVDEIGEAMGVVYQDDEPVDTDDKLEKRDQNPWELNPASAGRQFRPRVEQEFRQPLRGKTGGIQRKRTSPDAGAEMSPRAAVRAKTSAPAGRNIRNAATTRRGGKNNRVMTSGGRAAKSKHAGTSSRHARAATRRNPSTRRANKTTRARGRRGKGGRRGKKT